MSKSKKPKTETFIRQTLYGHEIYCRICKTRESLLLPMTISKYVKQADAFAAKHVDCVKAKQVK